MSKLVTFAALAAASFVLVPLAAQEVQDATIADPKAHSVVLENEHVRVISALAPAGYKSPLHSHPPLVVISLGTAQVRFTNADGSQQIATFRPGTVIWSDGGAHSWELLAGEANVIAVEVKSAAQAPSE
jgi:hypothetical protein